MITGLNTAIDYQGECYHVQTEDGGEEHPVITTLLFKGGGILLSRKTAYGETAKTVTGYDPEVVKNMMKEQHKNMLKDLVAGRIPLTAQPTA